MLMRGPLPGHIGVIMDGNGRWAQSRGQSRAEGHRRGASSLRRIIEECVMLGIPCLSTFAFSTENWLRPQEEVDALMLLMAEFAISEAEEMAKRDVRVVPIGDLGRLPERTRREIKNLRDRTREGRVMTLMIAVNYGGRDDILQAVQEISREVARGNLDPEEIDHERFRAHLHTQSQPDPDLIIRTGGEWRLSNFLLYQAAYAEFYSTEALWPEFDVHELHRALREFQRRERRYGGLHDRGTDALDGGGGQA